MSKCSEDPLLHLNVRHELLLLPLQVLALFILPESLELFRKILMIVDLHVQHFVGRYHGMVW